MARRWALLAVLAAACVSCGIGADDGGVAVTVDFDDSAEPVEIGADEIDAIVESVADDTAAPLFGDDGPPANLDAQVADQLISDRAAATELAERNAAATDADRAAATDIVTQQVAQRFGGSEVGANAAALVEEIAYLEFLVDVLANRIALARHLEETAGPDSGDPCVRQIVVATEAEAEAVRAEIEAGTAFVVAAVESSTGTSAARGGDLGCAAVDDYTPAFANAVMTAEVGELVGPFESPFGWHLVLVEGYSVEGDQLSELLVAARLDRATITVDPGLGTWSRTDGRLVPAE